MSKEKELDLICLFKTVIKEWRKLIILGFTGLVCGIIIAFSMPNEYKSFVVISSQEQGSGGSLNFPFADLSKLKGVSGSDNPVSFIHYPSIITSKTFLIGFSDMKISYNGKYMTLMDYLVKKKETPWWTIITNFPNRVMLYFNPRTKIEDFRSHETGDDKNNESEDRILFLTEQQGDFVGNLKNRITTKIDSEDGLLEIEVKMQNPLIAAIVADSIQNRLQQYVKKFSTTKARNVYQLSKEKWEVSKKAYLMSDSAYAVVYDRNIGVNNKSNQRIIDQFHNEKMIALNVYQRNSAVLAENELKIFDNIPDIVVIEKPSVPLRSSEPRRMIIIIGWAFIFVFVYGAYIVYKEIMKYRS